jgi:cell division protease FtsH
MVTRWGYSDVIGPVDYGSDQGDVFLGQQLMQSSHISEETSRKIEEEVRKLIEQGKVDARRVMTESRAEWEAVALGLLEYETLSGDEIAALIKGTPPSRPDSADDDAGPASAVPIIGKRKRPGIDPSPKPA